MYHRVCNRSKKIKRRLYNAKKRKYKRRIPKMPQETAYSYAREYVVINQEELDLLSKYILDYPDLETGGQLFGFWCYDGRPVVHLVLGPGPLAEHHSTFFMQDLSYLQYQANILKRKYGLEHIGEWHSHHKLGLNYPSSYDAINISSNMRKLGYAKFLLCIGTLQNASTSIKAFMFTQGAGMYMEVPWLIQQKDSSYRSRLEAQDAMALVYPETKVPRLGQLYLTHALPASDIGSTEDTYWFSVKANRKILKQILDQLSALSCAAWIPSLDANQEIHLTLYQDHMACEDIHFPKFFPKDPPIIRDAKGDILKSSIPWISTSDMCTSFLTYYTNLKHTSYDQR